ncbi:LONP2-like protein [Mya arenaria]|uniref:Lon protease homolog n=1 Tax=Mya arenaria TaxID=6604 RepID=A0ABY7ERP3_MYAAR|nr:LONP2-like protein [Mya arenaria]
MSNSISIPRKLPLLQVADNILLPGSSMRIPVRNLKNMNMVKTHLLGRNTLSSTIIGVIPREPLEDSQTDELSTLHAIGTAAVVVQVTGTNWPKPSYTLLVTGLCRFKLEQLLQETPYAIATVTQLDKLTDAVNFRDQAAKLVDMLDISIPVVSKLKRMLESVPSQHLPDICAALVKASNTEKIQVLDAVDLTDRFKKALPLLMRQIEGLKLLQKAKKDKAIEIRISGKEGGRPYNMRRIFRGKMKTDVDDEENEENDELMDLETKIKNAEMPEHAHKAAMKELKRLKKMPQHMPEQAMIRNYLELMVELPWSKSSTDSLDLNQARRDLDTDHFGLEKLKKRVLEYLAVRQLKKSLKELGKQVWANPLHILLDGNFTACDQSDIRGHRRTYIGSMPGRIIQGLKTVGTNNPVFLLDEVDKLGKSLHGDPASALLEVLDPEQNNSFTDHYMNVPFDLSQVMFIATANNMATIPPPLLDRMEIIQVPGDVYSHCQQHGHHTSTPAGQDGDYTGSRYVQVMFIATANNMATIPPPLLDRMEIIQVPGDVYSHCQQYGHHTSTPAGQDGDYTGSRYVQVMFIATVNNMATIPPPLLDRMEIIQVPGDVYSHCQQYGHHTSTPAGQDGDYTGSRHVQVMFIATVNNMATIPPPLLDRMEIIQVQCVQVMAIATAKNIATIPPPLLDRKKNYSILPVCEIATYANVFHAGYTQEEKVSIAMRHLKPKQLQEHGLTLEQLQIPDDSLKTIISKYTREAGVRTLERKLAAICRTVAVRVLENSSTAKREKQKTLQPEKGGVSASSEHLTDVLSSHDATALAHPPEMPIVIDDTALEDILGQPIYEREIPERLVHPGVAIGLAWTPMGGEIMFVEASCTAGEGGLTLTGQLGDVMKESASLAQNWLNLDGTELSKKDIHVHFPAGAVGKDGPSAGVTIATVLVSMFIQKCVRSDTAMTGEITLRGVVLPVGGIKEKVLAAHRAGLRRIILPRRNEKDLQEIPNNVKPSDKRTSVLSSIGVSESIINQSAY